MFHNRKKKQIILMRHAKAWDPKEFKGLDYDLPLSPAGESALTIVAKYIRLIGVKPDEIVASPAKRTRDTATLVSREFGGMPVAHIEKLYNGGSAGKRDADQIHLEVVHSAKRDTTIYMIVGHNNDLTNFASYLTGEPVPSMKKGSIVVLSVPDGVEWKDVKKGELSFVYYMTPHFLRLEELV